MLKLTQFINKLTELENKGYGDHFVVIADMCGYETPSFDEAEKIRVGTTMEFLDKTLPWGRKGEGGFIERDTIIIGEFG